MQAGELELEAQGRELSRGQYRRNSGAARYPNPAPCRLIPFTYSCIPPLPSCVTPMTQARSTRDSLAAELESVRREAEEERAAAARQEAAGRAAWGLEKAALAKRYQVSMLVCGGRRGWRGCGGRVRRSRRRRGT